MRDHTQLSRAGRRRLALRLLVAAACVVTCGDLLGALSSRCLRLNTSPSLPLGLYRVVDLPPERGRLVAACLPLSIARFGRARSYLPPGRCPDGAAPVLKYLAAVPGDLVEVSPSGVAVNGVPLRDSAARPTDSHGRGLAFVPAGRYRLRGCYWLAAPSPMSWDSRYFGCVPRSSLGEVLVSSITAFAPQP